jgi:PAS domain S-box-containing protein
LNLKLDNHTRAEHPLHPDHQLKVSIGLLSADSLLLLLMAWSFPELTARLTAMGAAFLVLFGTLWLLARSRQVLLASWVLVVCSFAILTAAIFTSTGISSPCVTGYLLLVVAGGFLLGWRVGAGLTAASVLSGALAVVAEYHGWLPKNAPVYQPWVRWAINLVVIGNILVLEWVREKRVRQAFERAQTELEGRIQAEQERQRSEAEYQELVGLVPAIVWRCDARTFQFTFVSQEAETILGYPTTRWVEEPNFWVEHLHPQDREWATAFCVNATREGRAHQFEYRMVGATGKTVWLQDLVHVRHEAGQPKELVGVMVDITGRKQLEQQLLQAQKMEAVGRLAGGVAHDFNNLLTVINGYSDLMLRRRGPVEPFRQELQEIRKAGERAAGLTRQLLAFGRKQIVDPAPLNLNRVVGEMEKMLSRLIGEHIQLDIRLGPALGSVMADFGQIQQVLMNLAVNARDAMRLGGTLRIQTSNVDIGDEAVIGEDHCKPGQYVLLEVSDTGAGMQEEVRRHIFEPFFTTKGEGAGTGLGLSMVYGIVQQANGWISVSSEPGHGSTFQIYLPRLAAPVSEPIKPVAALPPARATETVLMVEDQEEVRNFAVAALEEQGYRVLEASNGREALLMAERHPDTIALMITDVVMPGMHGRELAQQVAPWRPQMKVLYVSGYPADVIAPQGLLEPGVHYLPKPYTSERLSAKIRTVLDERPALPSILVVDDEEGIRAFLGEILKSAGYEVLEASNGVEALRQVEAHEVEMVITDLVMPEREGLETVMTLRDSYPHLKIIAMSGAFGGEFLKAVKKLGAHATIHKPIDAIQLCELVEQVLGR